MHILFFLNGLTTGGAERVAVHLCNHWATAGHRVTIATLKSTESDHFILHPSIQRVVLGHNRPSRTFFHAVAGNFLRLRALRRCLYQLRPDIAISMMTTANCLLAMAPFNGQRIGSERLHPPAQELGWGWRVVRKLTYRKLDMVVAQTQETTSWIKKNLPTNRVATIANPIVLPLPDTEPIVPVSDFADKQHKIVLAVGRLVPQKGFDRLIRSFAMAQINHPNWNLVILGEGPKRQSLEQIAGDADLLSHVFLPGRAGNLKDWYRRADIFALTSRFEGFPNALLEAMAHETAVISTDCPTGPSDLIDHEKTGLLVPMDNPQQFTEGLEKLMGDADLRDRLSSSARQSVTRYDISDIARQWQACFQGR